MLLGIPNLEWFTHSGTSRTVLYYNMVEGNLAVQSRSVVGAAIAPFLAYLTWLPIWLLFALDAEMNNKCHIFSSSSSMKLSDNLHN